MENNPLFSPYKLGNITLKNKVVMAPLTRSRAIGNIPNDLMATYYGQRAGAGLIIAEGTSPSPNGLGYARIPGAFSQEQVEGWKKITEAVHKDGGRIFIQLMHTGRVSHPDNLSEGATMLAPSAVQLTSDKMYVDGKGQLDMPKPKAMTAEEVQSTMQEYVDAAKNAIQAGFDGVELHAANGYLLEQFIHPKTNQRTDNYGGSIENRNRFVVETAKKTGEAIGFDKVGIRVSPYGAFSGMGEFEGVEDQHEQLAKELGKLGLVYMHIVDHESMGAPHVPESVKTKIREGFGGTIILSGGYDKASASQELGAGKGHLVAFGRPFISNPDLVDRMLNDIELATPDHTTFYTPGPEGYTDYAFHAVEA